MTAPLDLVEAAPHGRCPVCKRPLPKGTRKPWTYCPPAEGEDKSACSRIESRFAELKRHLDTLVEDMIEIATPEEGDQSGVVAALDDARLRQYLQFAKSRLWAEINTLTNRGRLIGTVHFDPKTGAPLPREAYERRRSGWWRAQPVPKPPEPPTTREVDCLVCQRTLRQPLDRTVIRAHYFMEGDRRRLCSGTRMRLAPISNTLLADAL